MNTLYYGDNLEVLRKYIKDETVDLCYLDPPFNSKRDYNVLFREKSGGESPAQIKAFGDTWNWAGAAEAWADFPKLCPVPKLIELMQGFHNTLGENDVMAYLVMMAPRLYHLHRVLKPTGSLYLHCDPTASHYLKLVLDCIFHPRNFRNEIVWVRHQGHSDAHRFGSVHDVIFYYRKSRAAPFHKVYTDYSAAQLSRYKKGEDGRYYTGQDLTGAGWSEARSIEWRGVSPGANRHWMWSIEEMERLYAEGRILLREDGKPRKDGHKVYLDEMHGKPSGDVWDDIPRIPNTSGERLGFQTQKPLALLERIICASSNPGDTVLDPFCGCGTAIHAAQKLDREWIGIDITPIATTLIQKRLYDAFGARDVRLLGPQDSAQHAFCVEGLPTDVEGARAMFHADAKKFEMWAVGLVPALPQERKGADKGIDGFAYFNDNPKGASKAVIQVKGGHVTVNQIRDLRGVKEREKAALAFFITLESPTKPMVDEARSLGFYEPPSGVGRRVEACQIRTIEQLLSRHTFDFPLYGSNVSFQQALAESMSRQASLEL